MMACAMFETKIFNFFVFINFFVSSYLFAAEIYPDVTWLHYKSPEQAGFTLERLDKIKKFYNKKSFSALLVVKDGAIAIDWGENDRRFPIHSIRKSLLSALYGIHSSSINFQASLADLNCNDNSLLTDQELSAKVFDVISSRSGVYLPAAAENNEMRLNKPARGSYKPSKYWWYNNWDFNVAGTLFSKITGEEILGSIATQLAAPLQMQDYRVTDGYYVKAESEHSAFQIRMSSRDLARFGLLYARGGVWNGKQLISHEWIVKSTSAISNTNMGDKYPPYFGLMWWVEEDGSFSARGNGGHTLAVYPSLDMVVVLRTDTYLEHTVSAKSIHKMLSGIISISKGQQHSKPSLITETQQEADKKQIPELYRFNNASIALDNGLLVSINFKNETLFVDWGTGKFELSYLNNNRFIISDLHEPLEIEVNDVGELIDIKTPKLFFIQAATAAKYDDLLIAESWVEKAIKMNPNSPIPYVNLAKIQIERGNKEGAKENLKKALSIEVNNKQAKKLYKKILLKQYFFHGLMILILVGFYLRSYKGKV